MLGCLDAQPTLGVQDGADGRLKGEGEVSVAGAETVRQVEGGKTLRQLLLRGIAAALHIGAAAGVQNGRLGHVPDLGAAQERFEFPAQSAAQQGGLVALGQHGLGRLAGQSDAGTGQMQRSIFPNDGKDAENMTGNQCGGEQRGNICRLLTQLFRCGFACAQIPQSFVQIQLRKDPP